MWVKKKKKGAKGRLEPSMPWMESRTLTHYTTY